MINVSKEFLETWLKRRDAEYIIDITFANGDRTTLSNDEISLSNASISTSAGSSALPLGNAISKIFSISLANNFDQWSEFDFVGAEFDIRMNFKLSESTETIRFGKYYVVDPENYGTTIKVSALDRMYKLDKELDFSRTTFPQTAQSLFLEICQQCNVDYYSAEFPNMYYSLRKPEEGCTCRELLGYIAMIAGGNAFCDEFGRIKIVPYDLRKNIEYNSKLADDADDADGGRLDDYTTGDNFDGGDFFDYSSGAILSGGHLSFKPDLSDFETLEHFLNLTTDTDDVVITKLIATDDLNEISYSAPADTSDTYCLVLKNPLFEDYQDILNKLSNLLVGLKFRPFSAGHICYPFVEFGDNCYILDRKGNIYVSIITDIEFALKGVTELKCSADSPLRNSSKYATAETKTFQKAKELVNIEKNEREKAIESLAEQIAEAGGLFITKEELPDGSFIYYLHNKKKLSESDVQWKMTATTISVSTDRGKTFNAALDASGTAILNRIYAIGIDASYITTGTLSVGGKDNKRGEIYVYDANDKLCGIVNSGGLAMFSEITQQQVVISPEMGLVQRDAQGNEFYGLTHVEEPEDFPNDGSRYKLTYKGVDSDSLSSSYGQYESRESSSSPTGTEYRWYWTFVYNHIYANWVPETSNYDYYVKKTYKLPDIFKGKNWIIQLTPLISIGDTVHITKYINYDFVYDSNLPNCKADGSTWAGWTDWNWLYAPGGIFEGGNVSNVPQYSTAQNYRGTPTQYLSVPSPSSGTAQEYLDNDFNITSVDMFYEAHPYDGTIDIYSKVISGTMNISEVGRARLIVSC